MANERRHFIENPQFVRETSDLALSGVITQVQLQRLEQRLADDEKRHHQLVRSSYHSDPTLGMISGLIDYKPHCPDLVIDWADRDDKPVVAKFEERNATDVILRQRYLFELLSPRVTLYGLPMTTTPGVLFQGGPRTEDKQTRRLPRVAVLRQLIDIGDSTWMKDKLATIIILDGFVSSETNNDSAWEDLLDKLERTQPYIDGRVPTDPSYNDE